MRLRCALPGYIFLLVVVILASSRNTSMAQHGASPIEPLEPRAQVLIGNARASVDVSYLSHGLIRVKYNETEAPKKLKVLIEKDLERYTYDLNPKGEFEPLPLQMGDGTYSLKVLSNIVDNRYAVIFGTSLDVQLVNENAPFLTAHQLVKFDENSTTAELAQSLTADAERDDTKIEIICSYIVDNISYDYDKAKTVKPGYLPVCDEILEAGKGICFDYASLLAAMLRSVGIPAKLVTGYVAPDDLYHAWNEVYIQGTGWIRIGQFYSAYKEGQGWLRMDATYTASMKDGSRASEFIGNPENYIKRLEY